MEFRWHFLFGFVTSYILIYFFDFSLLAGLIIFLASFGIDIDHYFWYALYTKDWNPKSAIRWHEREVKLRKKLSQKERENFAKAVMPFHGIPALLVLFLLSYLHPFFLWILIGFSIHLIADWIHMISVGEPLYLKTFPCYTIIKNKNKKPLGRG